MLLAKWNPASRNLPSTFGAASRDLNELMDDFFGAMRSPVVPFSPGKLWEEAVFTPSMDLSETDDTYIARFEVPGFTKENLTVEIDGDILRVSGKMESSSEQSEERCVQRESVCSSFTRETRFQTKIMQEGHQAAVKDGILTVTIKKAQPAHPEAVKVAIK